MVLKKINHVLGNNCSDKTTVLLKLPKLQADTVDFPLNLSREWVTVWSVHIKILKFIILGVFFYTVNVLFL